MRKENLNQIAEGVKNLLEKEQEVLFCYLFGSFVQGDAIPKSDVDVAVYLSSKHRSDLFDTRLSLIEKFTRALGRDADIIILNTASPFLRYTILREGLLVFEHDSRARMEFELKAMNEYFDYKPILELYRDRLRASV